MRWSLLLLCVTGLAAVAEEDATGVIFDASPINIGRARYPRVFDPDDKQVYPPPALCANPAYRGFEGYKQKLGDAKAFRLKIGARPLVVVAAKAKDNDPFHASLVVGKEDAAKLRELNAKLGLLDKDKVLLVLGLSVVASTPAADAKDVKPDAPVTVTFGKPLNKASAGSSTLVRLSDAAGATVAAKLSYDAGQFRFTLHPSSPLAAGAKYTITVSRDAEAECRGQMDADFTLSFTTAGGGKDARGGGPRVNYAT